jgi:hypothetical protein
MARPRPAAALKHRDFERRDSSFLQRFRVERAAAVHASAAVEDQHRRHPRARARSTREEALNLLHLAPARYRVARHGDGFPALRGRKTGERERGGGNRKKGA